MMGTTLLVENEILGHSDKPNMFGSHSVVRASELGLLVP